MTVVPPVRTKFKGPFPPGPRSWIPGASLRAMQRDPVEFLTRVAREHGDVAHFTFGRSTSTSSIIPTSCARSSSRKDAPS